MKRALSLLIVFQLLVLIFLPSCAGSASSQPALTSDSPETTLDTDVSGSPESEVTSTDHGEDESDLLMPEKLTAASVESLPIANSDMTAYELRKLALDYFELQLSFQWTPDQDILDYPTTYADFDEKKTIETSFIYGGIPYQSTGTGNLYRWLEYYDEKTGVFHISEALAANGGYGEGAAVTGVETDEDGNVTYKKYYSMKTLFNQCSVASFWGWGRVVNSATFAWTADMNDYNGFIPVGCYTYPGQEEIDRFGKKTDGNPSGYDTENVILDLVRANGNDAMYRCYAQMKPADCLVSGGHARMVKSVNIVKDQEGNIDYPNSEVTVIEQIEKWGYEGDLNGRPFKRQGGIDRVYTFKALIHDDYIPFTFAEFLDPSDPQDKAHLDYYNKYADKASPVAKRYSKFKFTDEEIKEMSGTSVEKAIVFTTLGDAPDRISLKSLKKVSVGSNYTISDVFVTVYDPDGNMLASNIYRALVANKREVSMNSERSLQDSNNLIAGFDGFADGKNTVEISVQLSNGEKLVAYSGLLSEDS